MMVLGRMGLGFLVAVAVGWVVGNTRKEDLLKPRPDDDEHDAEAAGRAAAGAGSSSHLSGDFFFMGRFLVMGAAIAAAVQTFVPQTIVGERRRACRCCRSLAMMALAFLMSLCSRVGRVRGGVVHAVRARRRSSRSWCSGPMVDLKLGALYAGTYSRGFVRTVVVDGRRP